jgi:hypothetical protein
METRSLQRYLKPLVALVVIILVVIIGFSYFKNKGNSSDATIVNNGQVKSQFINLNQSFTIPIDGAKPDDKLTVTFQKAQLTNQILINNQSTFSQDGTKFLMLNVIIDNETSNRLNFNTRDVIRLIDQNNKPFAPSYFNGNNTTLEPVAVKKDVVGFLVPDSIKTYKIQYGTLTGDKQMLELKFK